MLSGAVGVLRPRETTVSATFLVDGFTQFVLSSGSNSFTLETSDDALIVLTRLILRVSEVCADGSPLSVRIDYIVGGSLVSLFLLYN